MELSSLKTSISDEITCLHHQDDLVLIGTQKSEVIKYKLQIESKNKEKTNYRLDEETRVNLSSKKTIKMQKKSLSTKSSSLVSSFIPKLFSQQTKVTKLLCDKKCGVIFIQYNNYLIVYDYSLQSLLYVVKESKGLTTFILDEHNSEAMMHRCLAVIIVSNQLLFCYYTRDFYQIVTQESLMLPEKVNCIKLYKSTLIVGYKNKKKYCKIFISSNDNKSGKSEDIFDGENPYIVLMDKDVLLRMNETIVSVNLHKSDDSYGQMSRSTIHFTEEPISIATKFPFVIGLLKDKTSKKVRIEIKNIYDRDFIQAIPFPKSGKLFTTSNVKTIGVFLADKTNLHFLCPLPYERLIHQLFRTGRCKEGFEVFNKMYVGEDEKEKNIERQKYTIKAAFVCLFNGEVEQAFEYFNKIINFPKFDIRELLWFFDNIDDINDNKIISVYKKRHNKSTTKKLKAILYEKERKKRSKDISHGGKSDKIKKEVEKKVKVINTLCRTELLKLLKLKRNPEIVKFEERVVIDNTIVKLLSKDFEKLEEFLRNKNSCTFDNVMKQYLSKFENPIYYALLLKSKGKKFESLEELKEVINFKEKQKDDKSKRRRHRIDEFYQKKIVNEAVDLLIPMIKKNEKIIFNHLTWIFGLGVEKYKNKHFLGKKDGDIDYHFFMSRGVEVLKYKRTPPLSSDGVIKFFNKHLKENCAVKVFEKYFLQFLETMISENGSQSASYHNELATLYIDMIEKMNPKVQFHITPGREGGNIGKYRQKLWAFLDISSIYDFDRVLGRLSDLKLYNEQCVVHKKLGQHEEALEILILKLKNFQGAENYCSGYTSSDGNTKFLEAHRKLKSEQFVALMKICFENRKILISTTKKQFFDLKRWAIKLLNKYSKFIDLYSALQILPNDVTLESIEVFLEKSLQQYVSNKRKKRLDKNLWRTHSFETRKSLMKLQKRYFVHDKKLVCKKCGKRITSSAICVYPNFTIVHYNCRYKGNDNVEPIQQRNFKRHPISLK